VVFAVAAIPAWRRYERKGWASGAAASGSPIVRGMAGCGELRAAQGWTAWPHSGRRARDRKAYAIGIARKRKAATHRWKWNGKWMRTVRDLRWLPLI